MKKKINKNKGSIVNDIIAFSLLLLPFNSTIYEGFPVLLKQVFRILPFFATFLLLIKALIKKKNSNLRFIRNDIKIILIFTILCLFILINNGNIMNGDYYAPLLYINYLFVFLISYKDKEIQDSVLKVLQLFLFEHIIGCIFEIVFPNLYLNLFIKKFLPNISLASYSVVLRWFNQKYVTGLTTHYSTIGIYLSISMIFYFYRFLSTNQEKSNEKKKNFIMFIVSLVLLLTTGKRAVVVFVILACVMTYLIFINKFSGFIKLLIASAVVIVVLNITSLIIPEVENSLIRIMEATGDSSFGNRNKLYEKAVDLWEDNMVLGNGWVTYRYYYERFNESWDKSMYDVHNIYLQLLCEIGLIGALFVLSLMLYLLIKNIQLIHSHREKNIELIFSLTFQLFFLLYGITGNPLYDMQCYLLYFASISIVLYNMYIYRIRVKEIDLYANNNGNVSSGR